MDNMDPDKLIDKYYAKYPEAKKYLTAHSRAVATKAEEIASRLPFIDKDLVRRAALLHDIGIYLTHAPGIGCYGKAPYIRHGILGREILEKEGLPAEALVAERHIGVGLTAEEIKEQDLPLPARDMTPQSPEEEIVAYADLFFSKSHQPIDEEKNPAKIKEGLAKFGPRKLSLFKEWARKYGH